MTRQTDFLATAALLAAALACGSEAATPPDCAAIRTSYASALKEAVVCTQGVPDACAVTRPAAPQDVCGCTVAVNPLRTAQLDQLAAIFREGHCPFDQAVCTTTCPAPARSCIVGAGGVATCAGP